MMGNIIVPLDGSPQAETVLPLAQIFTRNTNSTLTLLTVFNRFALLDAHKSEAEAYDYLDSVRECITTLENKGGLSENQVKIKVVYGSPGEEIGENSEFEQASLVMMTTHGRNPMSKLVLGSVASKLLQRNCCPLIVFKATTSADERTMIERVHRANLWSSTSMANRVVLALDGSELSEGAIPEAVEIAQQLGAELDLVAVIDPYTGGYSAKKLAEVDIKFARYTSNPEQESMHRMVDVHLYLQSVAHKIETNGLFTRVAVEQGGPATGIHEYARRQNASLIVMATRAGNLQNRFRLGSIADEVVRKGGIPVLMVPAFQMHPEAVKITGRQPDYQYQANYNNLSN
ncbi:MAG TPA: universal stress protein [Chloroflexia bacterium]|nr:universal stress protein [Chloroflexia bacterium]